MLLQANASKQTSRLQFQRLVQDTLQQVTEQHEAQVAIHNSPGRVFQGGVEQARQQCRAIEPKRVERLPGRQAAGVRRELQDRRVAEIGRWLQPADLGQHVSYR